MNGLLVMKFSINYLETENVMPTYEEIKVFMDNQKNPENRKVMHQSLRILNDPSKRLQKNLIRGDRVKVTSGEYKNLVGVVIDITDDYIKVDFSGQNPSLKETGKFKPNEIQKNFEIGEKVEILIGKRKGTTGIVIKLDEHLVHLVTENSNEEVAILSSDLRRNNGLGMGAKRIFKKQAGLSKFDMVTFNNSRSVGLVLTVGVGSCQVLDTDGICKNVQMVQVNNKLTKMYVGKNPFNQEIKPKYTVRVISGKNKSKSNKISWRWCGRFMIRCCFYLIRSKRRIPGFLLRIWIIVMLSISTIMKIFRDKGSLTTNEQKGSTFIIRKKILKKITERVNQGQDGMGYGIGDMNMDTPFQPRVPTNSHSFKVSLCGKKKKVRRGKWKGHEGIIKNVFGKNAKFELAAICKTVTIPLEHLDIPKTELEIGTGAFVTDRNRGPTGTSVQTGFKNNMMTPAYEPMNQFDDWGDN
jgi:transcription elongation factor SPT5